MREEWQLRPYIEIGLGSETSGDLEAFLYKTGVKSLWLVPRRSHEIRIGAALEYEGFGLLDGAVRDSYGVAECGIELRWLERFQVHGKAGDPGAYLIVRRFLPEVELLPFRGEPFTVTDQLEVGLTVGTRPRLSVWGRELPRLGLAYLWGDGLSSYRLNFGFPF
ncbi:MAG: hypothetical protein GY769_04930 [bacterium]|nr:hypothetical protein [bacterium]